MSLDSFKKSATTMASVAGIIASIANTLPTPRKNREAVKVGDMTVAIDWAVVVRPSAVPVLLGRPMPSDMSACMIGKMAPLKKPIDRAPNMSREKFEDPKNSA